MSDHIRTALADGVLTVTLDRADKKNAITQARYAALADATERARTDDAVRVLLLRAGAQTLALHVDGATRRSSSRTPGRSSPASSACRARPCSATARSC